MTDGSSGGQRIGSEVVRATPVGGEITTREPGRPESNGECRRVLRPGWALRVGRARNLGYPGHRRRFPDAHTEFQDC
jgi:hypothetical protein